MKLFYYRLSRENTKEINYKIGLCYSKLNNDTEAIKFLKNAIKIDRDYAEAYSELGYILYNSITTRGNAITYLTQAIKLNPDYAENYLWRGSCYEKIKDYDSAIADYSKGIELNNSDWQLYNYRGELYLFLKQWENAINDYKLFRKLYPQKEKLEIELYNERKYGTCLSLCFHTKNENVNHKEYFIQDTIMTLFMDIFRKVNDKFNVNGITSYSQSDLQVIHCLLKERYLQLTSIKTYIEFLDLMIYTGFVYTIIRNVDDIETNWLKINNKIILLNQNLTNTFAENISNNMLLDLEGI